MWIFITNKIKVATFVEELLNKLKNIIQQFLNGKLFLFENISKLFQMAKMIWFLKAPNNLGVSLKNESLKYHNYWLIAHLIPFNQLNFVIVSIKRFVLSMLWWYKSKKKKVENTKKFQYYKISTINSKLKM